jgi:hypothetical protein
MIRGLFNDSCTSYVALNCKIVCELEIIWEEAAATCFELLFHDFPGGTEEYHRKPDQSG